jgi:hypothetical protein
MSVFQQAVLAAETHLAEGLALKLRCTEKEEKSLMDLEGMRKLPESKMEGQSILHFNALIRETASRCLLLTWRGTRFNPTRMSSFQRVDVLALLKNLV